jgi:catalase
LGDHPAAKAFLTSPKPRPVSYATLPFYGVNTFKFVNAAGKSSFGRYQILPMAGEHYLTDAQATAQKPNYLQEEIIRRVAKGPVRFKLVVQLAGQGDPLDDPTIVWPNTRKVVELGIISITKSVADNDAAQRKLLFLPNALPAGIEVEDPMINARSAAYPISYSRRQQ